MFLSRKTTLKFLFLLMNIPLATGQPAGDRGAGRSVLDWFYAPEEVLEAQIQTDIEQLTAQKMTNEEVRGTMTITNAAGETLEIPVNIRARGRFRRRLCDFPPLKLDFDKSVLNDHDLNDFDEYKLVTHCLASGFGSEFVLKEFLTYRLYEILTDHSFRVQLFRIKYLGADGRRYSTSYGFVIEDEKEIAKRLGGKLIEGRFNVAQDSFIRAELYRHDVFQYMVCNTDWSLPMLRNMKLIWDANREAYFVVPYDFDFAGLVKAPYAVPNADLGQKNIRERHFMGVAGSMEELQPTLDLFRSKREEILAYIKGFKQLPGAQRRDMMKYVKSFYKSLEDGSFRAAVEGTAE